MGFDAMNVSFVFTRLEISAMHMLKFAAVKDYAYTP